MAQPPSDPVPSEEMDEADFVSRGFSGRRHQPEKLAERLPPGQSRNADDVIYAARLVDDVLIALEAGCAPQRIPTERIALTR